MTLRIPVQPAVLQWAADRAGLSEEVLRGKCKGYEKWVAGEAKPTLKQLEGFARKTRVSVGYLFLPTPPTLSLPIPDFRTVNNERIDEPSPELMDTIYTCQQRQEWYADYARSVGDEPLAFVGSASVGDDVVRTAEAIREAIDFPLIAQQDQQTWEAALSLFRKRADAAGVLVMANSMVGSNTHRPLDPAEFRGFALSDDLAPLIFVNSKDTKAAQMFTLAHELAHIWLGQTGLSDVSLGVRSSRRVETWCNKVAAEVLVPEDDLKDHFDGGEELMVEVQRFARLYKVSTLVILRRVWDIRRISRAVFEQAYAAELDRLSKLVAKKKEESGQGPTWLQMAPIRTSRRFAEAVLASSFEGRSTLKEGMQLLGCKKMSSFESLGAKLGVFD